MLGAHWPASLAKMLNSSIGILAERSYLKYKVGLGRGAVRL